MGLQSPASWIENRKASKHNRHLQDLMKQCGCDTMSGFINVTHAASVNDTFWVKKADDSARWDDVSLYRNEFNETISRLAFYGLGIADIDLSSTSPELVMDGSFPKCVKKEKDGVLRSKKLKNEMKIPSKIQKRHKVERKMPKSWFSFPLFNTSSNFPGFSP